MSESQASLNLHSAEEDLHHQDLIEEEDLENNLKPTSKIRKNRRRGKGKGHGKKQEDDELQLRTKVARRVAEEQVELIISKGFLAACWSMGVVLPQHQAVTPRSNKRLFANDVLLNDAEDEFDQTQQNNDAVMDYPLFDDVNWEGTLMSIIDRAAHDPVSMETLVQDLALALPEISLEIQQHQHRSTIGNSSSLSLSWDDFDFNGVQQQGFMESEASYLDFLLQVRIFFLKLLRSS